VPAQFILASNSPRRRALLVEAGYEFEVVLPAVSELASAQLSLRELTSANATRKAIAVARIYRGRIVLAADTLVAMEGKIMGKPRDLSHARIILRRLSGRTHDVCTAVCIIGPRGRISFTEVSQVRFRKLTESAITNYFTVVNPIDKAGAYAAQGAGGSIIATVKGSVTNVVGLPMERTKKALAQIDIRPSADLSYNFSGLGGSLCRFPFQYPIKKPDNETIGGENDTSADARPMKNVTQLKRN
jgi:septum formation protein